LVPTEVAQRPVGGMADRQPHWTLTCRSGRIGRVTKMQKSILRQVVNQNIVLFGGRDRKTGDGVPVQVRFDVKTLAL
jgi:hypothetical protein